jgi:hypothetical protein
MPCIGIATNGCALAHPKGLVAFLPLKINKEKKQLPTNAVLYLGFLKKVFEMACGGIYY